MFLHHTISFYSTTTQLSLLTCPLPHTSIQKKRPKTRHQKHPQAYMDISIYIYISYLCIKCSATPPDHADHESEPLGYEGNSWSTQRRLAPWLQTNSLSSRSSCQTGKNGLVCPTSSQREVQSKQSPLGHCLSSLELSPAASKKFDLELPGEVPRTSHVQQDARLPGWSLLALSYQAQCVWQRER